MNWILDQMNMRWTEFLQTYSNDSLKRSDSKEWFVHELDTATSLMKHQGDLRWMSRVFCEWWLKFQFVPHKKMASENLEYWYIILKLHISTTHLLSLYKASHEVGTTWEWAMFWWTIPSRNKHIILITHIRLTFVSFFNQCLLVTVNILFRTKI